MKTIAFIIAFLATVSVANILRLPPKPAFKGMYLFDNFVCFKNENVNNFHLNRRAGFMEDLLEDTATVVKPYAQPTLESSGDEPPSIEFTEESEFPKQSHQTLAIMKITASSLLNCTFDGILCGYKNYRNETYRTFDWNLGNGSIGNPETGIRSEDMKDSGFLYVGTDGVASRVITYILESPALNLQNDIKLAFDVYQRSKDITLQVCLNTPFYCPYTVSAFEKDVFWKEGESFFIPKGTTKIFFKAIQWRKFKWLAIANVRVQAERNSIYQ